MNIHTRCWLSLVTVVIVTDTQAYYYIDAWMRELVAIYRTVLLCWSVQVYKCHVCDSVCVAIFAV